MTLYNPHPQESSAGGKTDESPLIRQAHSDEGIHPEKLRLHQEMGRGCHHARLPCVGALAPS